MLTKKNNSQEEKMEIKKILALLIGVLIFSVLFTLSFTATYGAPAEKPPIKIGGVSTLTGPSAGSGINHDNGVRMALEEMGYEMAGRKVKVVFEDEEFKADVALTKAKRLLGMEGVHILIGVDNSASAYALREYVTGQKIPLLISCNAGADEVTKRARSPYVLRCSINNYKNTASLADYAYKHLGYRKMIVAAVDYVAGHEYAAAFARVFSRLGGKIVQEWYAPKGTPDFSPSIAKIDTTADALFTFIPGVDGLRFVKQYAEYGLKDKLPHICYATTEEEVLQDEGEAAVGIIQLRTWFPSIPVSANKKFVETYYNKYKECPTATSATGYVAIKLIANAAKAVKGNIEDTEAFLAALRVASADGPFGKVKFDKYGMVSSDMYIGKVARVEGKPWKYEHKVIYTYKDVDQFWPFTPEEYMAMPELAKFKGKLVTK
jgi:branched-chain amino acid transport system substrate-binding protein